MNRFRPMEEEEPQIRWRAMRLLACRSRADEAQDVLDRFDDGNPCDRSYMSALEDEEGMVKNEGFQTEDSSQNTCYEMNELPLSSEDPLKRVLVGEHESFHSSHKIEEQPASIENILPFRDNSPNFVPLSAIPVHRCESPSGTSQPPIPCREPVTVGRHRLPPTVNRMPTYSMLPPPKLAYRSRRKKLSRPLNHTCTENEEAKGNPGTIKPVSEFSRDTPNEYVVTKHPNQQHSTRGGASRLWETTLDTSREWWHLKDDRPEPSSSHSDDSMEKRERRQPSSHPDSSTADQIHDGRESMLANAFDGCLVGPFNSAATDTPLRTAKSLPLRYRRWSTLVENQDKKSSPTFQARKQSMHKPKVAVYDAISPSKANPALNVMSKSFRDHYDTKLPDNQVWVRTWPTPPLQRPPCTSGPTERYKISVTTIRTSESAEQSI